jgi:acetylornithine deacetylase/succinyl-diaminopimelate desuccinylase-like protein
VADDKGQLLMLVTAAAELAAEGALPVNVQFVCDGEEEVGGTTVARWFADADVRASACVIFDTGMPQADVPAFYLATRGILYVNVRLRTADADLHSGVYGGAALNAAHALSDMIAAVLPQAGRLPEPLCAGTTPPTAAEVRDWSTLQPGEQALGDVAAAPADERAAAEFYSRTFAQPSLDVHALAVGDPGGVRTVVPATAEASLSMRLAPDQSPPAVAEALERLLREAAPTSAAVELAVVAEVEPARVDPFSDAVELAAGAFAHALGKRPLMLRSGGTLPILPAIVGRGIPAIITGFALPESNVHGPNERLPLRYVELGIAAAKETFRRFADLPR